MPADSSRAVFLSYASQDAAAARRICEALRGGGLEVDTWFVYYNFDGHSRAGNSSPNCSHPISA